MAASEKTIISSDIFPATMNFSYKIVRLFNANDITIGLALQ